MRFGCIKACFWGHHKTLLGLRSLYDANHTRSEATRRFPRIFAVKKTTPRLTKYTMDQCAGQ